METRQTRRSHRLLALLFIAILISGFLSALVAMAAPEFQEELGRLSQDTGGSENPGFSNLRQSPLLDGRLPAAFQTGIEEALPFREAALTLWSAARYALFRSGAPGVVVGKDGWLFTAEEFEVTEGYHQVLRERLERVIEIRDELMERDIDLVVALVPSKARVQHQRLAADRPPALLDRRYDEALEILTRAGIATPDLRTPLAQPDSFLARDTHWTPEGARRAAKTIAPAIRTELTERGESIQSFDMVPGESILHTGDLMAFLPLGPFVDDFGLHPEAVRPFRSTSAAGDSGDPLDLFATPSIPVALIGTSYSADPLWSFHDFLQHAIREEVLPVAEVGRGPFAPMEAYLSSDTIVETPPVVVAWEIPERYLTVDP